MADFYQQTIDSVTHTWTPRSFTKTGHGDAKIRPWYKERLYNEAAALQLISSQTTIPVPRLKSFGTRDNGVPYLELERINGITCDTAGDECRMPSKTGHSIEGRCEACQKIATINAEKFITEVVLPQLGNLKSNTTGLKGFVIPSVWVLNHDKREEWKPKTSEEQEYIFCRGDLVLHNIMCDPETLEVTYLFDWEHAGYFPPGCQFWALDLEEYHSLFRDTDKLDQVIALIEA